MLNCFYCIVFFFFFKQKTAYEMRISDWSSDVCSSDLPRRHLLDVGRLAGAVVALDHDPPVARETRQDRQRGVVVEQVGVVPVGDVLAGPGEGGDLTVDAEAAGLEGRPGGAGLNDWAGRLQPVDGVVPPGRTPLGA